MREKARAGQRTEPSFIIPQRGWCLKAEQAERLVFYSALISAWMLTMAMAPSRRGIGTGNGLIRPELCHVTELRK